MRSGVILSHFPLHTEQRHLIYSSWLEYRWSLSWGMIVGSRFLKNMQPLNFLKEYYGEKFGFYFAWLVHYTGWLILPAIVGTCFGVYILIFYYTENKEWDHVLASPGSIFYGLFMMIWATLFHESWKRK